MQKPKDNQRSIEFPLKYNHSMIVASMMYMMDISWTLCTKVKNFPMCFLNSKGLCLLRQYPKDRRIQQNKIKAMTGYVSKMKKLVCPVLANLHQIDVVSKRFLCESKRRESLTTSDTGGTTTYLVLSEFFYHLGTSKKTKIAQNLTPS